MKKELYKIVMTLALVLSMGYASAIGNCGQPTASVNLEINNVRAKLLNGGDMFWDVLGNSSAAYEIPKNSGRKSNFTAALWLSARDAGANLYTAGQTYRQRGQDFWPGALNTMGEIDTVDCDDWNEMFSVTGREINDSKSGKGISYDISRWPSSHAPFFDANSDGIYDPSLGDYPILDASKPNLVPGQLVYWVYNDKGNTHTAYSGASAIGIEIQAFAYAFASNTSNAINNSTMYRYKITNKSNVSYTEFRAGLFNDFDLGNADDDYVGCDLSTNINGKKRNLFYVYNSNNNDGDGATAGYGVAPPAFGVTILNPTTMGSHMVFTNTGASGVNSDPLNATELDRYLKGIWADGQNLTYGTPSGRGGTDPCFFQFPGTTDPNGRPNWVETNPAGDRRSISSTAPRSLAPGEVMEIDFAYVWARDTPGTNLTSLEKLKVTTDTIINEYQTLFSGFSTGINSINKKEIRVYPNPASEYIVIEGISMIRKISIYNSQGKLVKMILKPTSNKISVEGLPQGTYYLSADGLSSKFIKL
jgi:hypothetical protein